MWSGVPPDILMLEQRMIVDDNCRPLVLDRSVGAPTIFLRSSEALLQQARHRLIHIIDKVDSSKD